METWKELLDELSPNSERSESGFAEKSIPEESSYVAYTTIEGKFAILARHSTRIVWRGSSKTRAIQLAKELNMLSNNPCGTPLLMMLQELAWESEAQDPQ
ncbi:MAG: hypothetical protein OXG03_08070 [Gammaproteobacteria bacterium]|nr:hypothetical protein [Gammaproteobacteria bacterium]